MTDNEIKKALECCVKSLSSDSCNECPLNTTKECDKDLLAIEKYALDLINRQQEEIDRLRKEVNLVSIQFQDLQERYEEAQAENERLKNILICFMGALGKVRNIDDIESISVIPLMTELNKGIRAEIKTDAYKECIEKVRKLAVGMQPCSDELRVFDNDLDNLLKELMGENND